MVPVVTTNSVILALIKTRMATLWYWLTQFHLEMAIKTERETDLDEILLMDKIIA